MVPKSGPRRVYCGRLVSSQSARQKNFVPAAATLDHGRAVTIIMIYCQKNSHVASR